MASVLGTGTGRVGSDDGAVTVAVAVDPVAVPGGVARADLYVFAARDVVLQGGDMSLGYTLAYRYNAGFFGATYTATARQEAPVAALSLRGPTLLREGHILAQEVLLPLPPDALPTAQCPLVTVRWSATATVRYDGTQEASEAAPVVVVGQSRGADPSAPLTLTGGRRRDDVALRRLSGRAVRPGDRIAGEVVVVPRRPGPIEQVRAELVLVALVPHGPWLVPDPSRNPEPVPKETETVVAVQEVAGPNPARPGEVLAWPFALDVPPVLPAPSLVTPEFSLRWLLRVVVERRRRRRTRASLELAASTGP